MAGPILIYLHNQTLKRKPGRIYTLWLMLRKKKKKKLKIWVQASDFIS